MFLTYTLNWSKVVVPILCKIIQTSLSSLKYNMSTNSFLTTRTSTTAGLAAVAYGSSLFFYFVQDQIRGAHPLYDIHRSRPSSLLIDMLGSRGVFEDYLISKNFKLFSKIEKLYPEKSSEIYSRYLDVFLREIDNLSEYSVNYLKLIEEITNIFIEEISFGTYVSSSSEAKDFSKIFVDGLSNEKTDMSKLIEILTIIMENPSTKFDDAPSDLILRLRKGLSTEYNHKGFTKQRVEIPINQWEANFTYRDISQYDGSRSRIFVTENYEGYGIDFLLDPSISNGLTTQTIYEEDGIRDYEFPRTNPSRLKEGEQRIINFDLINSPTGLVEV